MKAASLPRYRVLAGLIAGMLPVTGTCHAQSDNFDDNNDDGWTRYDPLGVASFSAAGGVYRIRSGASPDPGTFGRARAASLRQGYDYSDFCVVVDIVAFDDSLPEENRLPQAIGIIARVGPNPSAGNTRGYTFTFQPMDNDVQINRITGELPDGISPVVTLSPSPAPGTILRMVFFGNGSHLEGRLYDASDLLNPLAVASAYDTAYPNGTCGLVITEYSPTQLGTADATFDNYAANGGTAPPLFITRDAAQAVTLRWPDSALCWQLQSSPTLEDTSWTDVTTGITHQTNDETFSLAHPIFPGEPQRYWRLRFHDGT